MIRLKKHIAIPLVGIFLFPIVFQAMHIVWHHAHGYGNPHDVCHRFAPVKTPQSGPAVELQQDDLCTLCEYKISVNAIPKASVFRTINPLIQYFSERLEIQRYIFPLYSSKSPRAPPAFLI